MESRWNFPQDSVITDAPAKAGVWEGGGSRGWWWGGEGVVGGGVSGVGEYRLTCLESSRGAQCGRWTHWPQWASECMS